MKKYLNLNTILLSILMFLLAFYKYTKEFFHYNSIPQLIVLIITISIFLIILIFSNYRIIIKKHFFILLGISYLTFRLVNPNYLILYICFIAFEIARDLKKEKFISKVYLFSLICFFIFLVSFFYLFDFNAEFNTGRWENGVLIQKRSLGFTGPNSAALNFLTIILTYFLICEKYSYKSLIICLGLNLLIYYLTSSRTTFYLLTIFLLFLFIIKKCKKSLKINSPVMIFIFYIIFTLILVIKIGPNSNNFLNRMFSDRFNYSFYAIKDGISLFGKNEEPVFVIDNFVIYILYYSGYMGLLIILIFTYTLLKNRSLKGKTLIIYVIILLALFFEVSFTIASVPIAIFLFRTNRTYPVNKKMICYTKMFSNNKKVLEVIK